MHDPIDFYFDFSSPYGYFASTQIKALADEVGRTVCWHPILLGPMFKTMGSAPLVNIPLKGEYSRLDFQRTAELFGIDFHLPDPFPLGALGAARAMLSLQQSHGAPTAVAFAQGIYRAYFVDGKNISELSVVLELAERLGIDAAQLHTAIQRDEIKSLLREENDKALKRGVFGSPFLFVDGEPFWGFDRFDHIRKWIARKGTASR